MDNFRPSRLFLIAKKNTQKHVISAIFTVQIKRVLLSRPPTSSHELWRVYFNSQIVTVTGLPTFRSFFLGSRWRWWVQCPLLAVEALLTTWWLAFNTMMEVFFSTQYLWCTSELVEASWSSGFHPLPSLHSESFVILLCQPFMWPCCCDHPPTLLVCAPKPHPPFSWARSHRLEVGYSGDKGVK